MIDRRTFPAGTGAGLLAAPLAVEAQQAGKVYRIGHITSLIDRPERMEEGAWPVFIQGLNSLGWIEGKNIVVCVAGARAQTIRKVARTIPIVTLNAGELVASGIVQNLARPVGNITGMQDYSPEKMGKRVQMLKELVPTLSRVAVLRRGPWRPGVLAAYRQATDDPAQKLGIRVRYVWFQSPEAIPDVFAEMVKERDRALLIWNEPELNLLGVQILDLAVNDRLPTMANSNRWSKFGALMAYGGKRDDIFRQAATYVDRILKGAKPGDLPIGQPTTFELVFNMKTAKAFGLTIPLKTFYLDHVADEAREAPFRQRLAGRPPGR